MIDLRAPLMPKDLVESVLSKRYTLKRLLGSGGMGGVYEAHDAAGNPCAVKVVRSEIAGEEGAKRMMREARLARKLSGPHVVPVIDDGHDEERDLPFLVMPLLEGSDLAKLLEKTGALNPAAAVRLAIQACRGLSEAHTHEIVHRDVKPSNLLLCSSSDGEIVLKVCDFGIAKRPDRFGDTQLTRTGRSVGSPAYMSPEQARGEEDLNEQTDIWSLGVTLYEMLSGQTPWGDANSPSDLQAMIANPRVPRLLDVAPWVDATLAEVVERALSPSRDARWASADAFASALDPFSEGSTQISEELLKGVDPTLKQSVIARSGVRSVHPEGKLAAFVRWLKRALFK